MALTNAWQDARRIQAEQEADTWLRSVARDTTYPAYTEKQLARKGQGRCVLDVEDIQETILATGPVVSAQEEIRFLMTLTALTAQERCVVEGWLSGWTQTEMQSQWAEALGHIGQQTISKILRRSLRKLLDVHSVSFSAFSRHSLYRRPTRRRVAWKERCCRGCGEPYVQGMGEGFYCSQFCREAKRRRYV
jgi:hypothetical protein